MITADAIVPIVVAIVGLIGSAYVGRHSGKAAIIEAIAHAKATQDANWKSYTEILQRDNDSLRTRIENAEGSAIQRLSEVEAHSQRRLEDVQTEYLKQIDAVKHTSALGLAEVERRLGDSEIRAQAAEIRAHRSEGLYSLAVVYLRRLSTWVNDHWPDENVPPPPPELERDLT